jgi:geranylgeranyl diphosphate synthase, type I
MSVVSSLPPAAVARVADPFEAWRGGLQQAALATVTEFVGTRCVADLGDAGVDVAADILVQFVGGGKCLRSTFAYLGWLCGAAGTGAALRGCASFELLHAFALLQDDVMDGAALRRGRPAAHVQFARWHSGRRLSGSARRFGESAAVLLGDLCLVWAEQMLRESGLGPDRLDRAWPRYDAMRTELAVGQFSDLVNDARGLPTLESVLDVARRKSGNYTVCRPLEIGAAMAGCDEATIALLGRYGTAVGEAFQLRDDVLGVFGSTEVTGKPAGGDLAEHKASSIVVAAHHMADGTIRRQLSELMGADDLDEAAVARWRTLIVATGAVQWVEEMITERVRVAREEIHDTGINEPVRLALAKMAAICTVRAA